VTTCSEADRHGLDHDYGVCLWKTRADVTWSCGFLVEGDAERELSEKGKDVEGEGCRRSVLVAPAGLS